MGPYIGPERDNLILSMLRTLPEGERGEFFSGLVKILSVAENGLWFGISNDDKENPLAWTVGAQEVFLFFLCCPMVSGPILKERCQDIFLDVNRSRRTS